MIEKAKIGDIESILDLHEEVYSAAWKTTGRGFSREYIRSMLENVIDKDSVFVSKIGGDVVAFCWGRRGKDYFGNLYGEIVILLVKPELQRKGIGKQFISFMEKELGATDVRLSVLDFNENAKKLYRSLGFQDFLVTMRKC